MSQSVAFLFPGQGAYAPGVAQYLGANRVPTFERILKRIDEVIEVRFSRKVSSLFFGPQQPSLDTLMREDNDLLQLAIYAASVGSFEVLRELGAKPDYLMGHSFGEIAALVCAGCFTVEEGAELVCERSRALESVERGLGYMLAVSATEERARHLVGLCHAGTAAVAVVNSADQIVISGATPSMDSVALATQAFGISTVRLASAFPFHSDVMRSAVPDLERRVRSVVRGQSAIRVLRARTFSPILGRFYEEGDDLAALLASHLITPVRFEGGVRTLASLGVRTFVECGARGTLGNLVQRSLRQQQCRVLTVLPDRAPTSSLEEALVEFGLVSTANRLLSMLPDFERALPPPWKQLVSDVCELVSREVAKLPASQSAPLGLVADAAASKALPQPSSGTNGSAQKHLLASAMASAHSLPLPPKAPEHTALGATARAPTPAVAMASPAPALDRAALFQKLVVLYSSALEYPADVFEESVHLEADLGVDSVKQTELLGRVAGEFGLPEQKDGIRVADYPTLGHIIDLVVAHARELSQSNVAALTTNATRMDTTPADTNSESNGASDAARTTERASGFFSVSREQVLERLIAFYASALEYPPDVFEENVGLEADLGVDSVKQTELLARVAQEFHLPEQSEGFKAGEFQTLGRIADLVMQSNATPAEVTSKQPAAAPSVPRSMSREQLYTELRRMYATALEYPEDVFDNEDVELEADLGVDSVKQTELFGRVAEHYALPPRPDDFQLARVPSLGKVADFVMGSLGGSSRRDESGTLATQQVA